MLENKNNKLKKVEDLGEFELIKYLTDNFDVKHSSTLKAIGDDAAIIKHIKNTVISTDLLIENVHFDLSYVPLKHLGYKAVMVNLSDIYAMNADAKQITVSIAVSNRFSLDALEELYKGIHLACKTYNIDLIGGDTTTSQKGLTISITSIGEVSEEKTTLRSTAKPTDLIVVSGDLGAAYLGLQILEREKQVFLVDPNNQPDITKYSYLIERQLKPEARKDIVDILEKLEVKPTSMIDISDGLSSEILHICNQSKVGCNLFEEKIPIDPTVFTTCEEFEMNASTIALNGGEDYELLFTIDLKDYDKIKGNPNLTVIGHITDKNDGRNLITRANQQIEITAQGWNSFDN